MCQHQGTPKACSCSHICRQGTHVFMTFGSEQPGVPAQPSLPWCVSTVAQLCLSFTGSRSIMTFGVVVGFPRESQLALCLQLFIYPLPCRPFSAGSPDLCALTTNPYSQPWQSWRFLVRYEALSTYWPLSMIVNPHEQLQHWLISNKMTYLSTIINHSHFQPSLSSVAIAIL